MGAAGDHARAATRGWCRGGNQLLADQSRHRDPDDRRPGRPRRRLRHRRHPLPSPLPPAPGPGAVRPRRYLALGAADRSPQRSDGAGAGRRCRPRGAAALLAGDGQRAAPRLRALGPVIERRRRLRVLQLESRLRAPRLAAQGPAAAGRAEPQAALLEDRRARPLRRLPLARAAGPGTPGAGAALAQLRQCLRRIPRLGPHGPLQHRLPEQPARGRRRHPALGPGPRADRCLRRRHRAGGRRADLRGRPLQRPLLLASADAGRDAAGKQGLLPAGAAAIHDAGDSDAPPRGTRQPRTANGCRSRPSRSR